MSSVESPWLWVGIFCAMGLVALVVLTPKYRQRQPQLERQFFARQMGGQSVMGDHGPSRPRWGGRLLIPLAPLEMILAGASALSLLMFGLEARRTVIRRRLAAERESHGLETCQRGAAARGP